MPQNSCDRLWRRMEWPPITDTMLAKHNNIKLPVDLLRLIAIVYRKLMLLDVQNHSTCIFAGRLGRKRTNLPFKLHDASKKMNDIVQMAPIGSKSMTLLRKLSLLKWSEILIVIKCESRELIKNTDKNTTAIISYVCLVIECKQSRSWIEARNFQKIVKKKWQSLVLIDVT